MQPCKPSYDIIIVGSGIVGAATALALAKHTTLNIAVLEAKAPTCTWSPDQVEQRVSALALSSRALFENIGVWKAIMAKRVSPYHQMRVCDSAGDGVIEFSAAALHEDVLGYIVEDNVMRMSLLDAFNNQSNLTYLTPVQIASVQEQSDYVELVLADQQRLTTRLLIAADGAESWVRNQAGIELKTWDYQHTAMVATVKTALPHQATAQQRFLPTGPLAFLPLSDSYTSSIVWSATPEYAAELLALNDAEFNARCAEAFAQQLGAVDVVSPRLSFPLRMRHATQYVRQRIALIGDAAHTVHPLAGQGVNLGLLDAATLADVIIEAHKKNRDIGSLATLRRYERWRKGDTLAMLVTIEGLKRLFALENKPVQWLRNAGLNITNHLPLLKKCLANYALGKRSDLLALATQPFLLK